MITLYHASSIRSHLIRFVLEELGLAHELRRVDISSRAHKQDDYKKLNPLGQLPALVDGDTVVCESIGCALYLTEKADEPGLAPEIGSNDRGRYYHWVAFAIASEVNALSKIAMHTLFLPEPMRVPAIARQGLCEWEEVAQVLSQALDGRDWLLGERFSTADCMVGGALWLANLIDVLAAHSVLKQYYSRIQERPAFQRAFAD